MSAKTKQNKNKVKTQAELAFEEAQQAFDRARLGLSIAKTILKTNAAFEKANPAQRRVIIAEDALQQLKIGKFIATPGTYVNACELADEAELKGEVQLNTLLHNPTLKSSCDVCARGALLLSAVRHRNDCTIDDGGTTSEDSWVREFSEQQEVIEAAFEDYEYDGDNENGNLWCNKFLSKKERDNATTRLELILKNIIRNKGTFKANQR